jgi:hypothetical protein
MRWSSRWRSWSGASIPGLVIYLAGADPHEGDRLGRLKLSFRRAGGARSPRLRLGLAARVPLAFAMAGGYGIDIEDTVQAQVNTFRVALQYALAAGRIAHATMSDLAEWRHEAPARAPRPAARPLPVFRTIGTRWMDNDVYGHVNNVVYYSWFDTAVNAWLIEQGALDIHAAR